MTYELLVSTRKGLIIGRSDDRRRWEFAATQFPGWQVDYAVRDARHGRIWAAVSHMQWGPHLHCSDDGGASWSEAPAPEFRGQRYSLREWDVQCNYWSPVQTRQASLARIWTIEPSTAAEPDILFAGVDPAALFVSRDRGKSWELDGALWDHPTRAQWVPGAAGLMVHHVQVDRGDPRHLYVAISAAGVFETRDGGSSWAARNRGCRADHLPDPESEAGQCVHSLHLHPARPGRLFQQHHPGMYRSDDGGDSWISIREGLPGEFGFASTVDPNHADTFYVLPLEFDQARVPAQGKLRVYRTRDAGQTWQALDAGLPQHHVLQGAYRQALCHDATADSRALGLYLGTSGGHVYASRDGGDHWVELLEHVAPVTAVRCSAVP